LFLGHAETLRGLSTEFHLRHTHETFYYQRCMASEELSTQVTSHAIRSPSAAVLKTVPLLAMVDATDSWVNVIRQASERVDVLTGRPPRPVMVPGESVSTGAPPIRTPAPRKDLALAMGLLRQERFAEADAVVCAMPPEAARDPDVLLLKAVLLAHTAQLVEAERVCVDLLAIDDFNAGAHYVVALCREYAGDPAGAIRHDQMAAYLDPGFAMPHLHRGLLARRTRDYPTACQELRHALTLLEREDASRLLLFGGGFSREALIALCEAEIGACGGGV
jgi:chemotaxis protein methyltransferase CheR